MIFSISSHSVVLMYIYLYTSILRPARLAANQRFPFSIYPNLGLLVKGIPMVGHNRTHTHTKRIFFFFFFLFILNKKGNHKYHQRNIYKEITFLYGIQMVPFIAQFQTRNMCRFLAVASNTISNVFLSLFHVQWIWNMNRHSVTVPTNWVALHEFFSTCHKSKKESRVRYGFLFWVNPFAEIFFSLSFSEVRDSRLTVVFLPWIYRHLL